MSRIVVVGDGAWGRALAGLAKDGGHVVALWSRRNPEDGLIAQADALIIAVPAQAVAKLLPSLNITPTQSVIITAKGIDRDSNQFMYQVARKHVEKQQVLILSGPSFAEDVQHRKPTAVALAAAYHSQASHWAKALSQPHFRVYASDDPMGVSIGGALKNVLAIACGIADGKHLGASARAALITRGFAELMRLGKTLGARPETMMGLSGLGDLLLTCSSPQSRNYSFGKQLGEGQTVQQALAAASGVVEGAYSAQAALQLAIEHSVLMPITQAVNAIIENNASPDAMIDMLLSRPVGSEI